MQCERPIQAAWIRQHPGICSSERLFLSTPFNAGIASERDECRLPKKCDVLRTITSELRGESRSGVSKLFNADVGRPRCRAGGDGCNADSEIEKTSLILRLYPAVGEASEMENFPKAIGPGGEVMTVPHGTQSRIDPAKYHAQLFCEDIGFVLSNESTHLGRE